MATEPGRLLLEPLGVIPMLTTGLASLGAGPGASGSGSSGAVGLPGWAILLLTLVLVVPLALLAWIGLRARRLRIELAEHLASLEGRTRRACPGCGALRLVRPSGRIVLCLSCGARTELPPRLNPLQARVESLAGMPTGARRPAAAENLRQALELLSKALERARTLPGFLSLDYLGFHEPETASWEERDRAAGLREVLGLLASVETQLLDAAAKVAGLPEAERPGGRDPATRQLEEVVRNLTAGRDGCGDMAHLVPWLDQLVATVRDHLRLLEPGKASPGPPEG